MKSPTLLLPEEKEELKSKFIKDVFWVITYELFYKKKVYPSSIFYYKESDERL